MSGVCQICGGTVEPLFTTRDHNRRISNQRFTYTRCQDCGLIKLDNPPDDLGSYYRSDYYAVPTGHQLELALRADQYKIDLLIEHAPPPGRLIEIGPAFGIFARLASKAGYAVDAIEMDERTCAYLRDELGINAIQSADPTTALGGLQPARAVVMWQAIEHLPDPWTVIEKAAALLEPGGVLVIATPNPNASQFKLMGARWPHVDAPRHLTLIPSGLLIRKAAELGLTAVSVNSDLSGDRRWNRFGWQRALMNSLPGTVGDKAGLAVGRVVEAVASAVEHRPLRGASYTAVFRKS